MRLSTLRRSLRRSRLAPMALLLLLVAPAPIAAAAMQEAGARAPSMSLDDADLLDRPVSSVEIVGLSRLGDAEVRQNIRVAPGQPFDPSTIRGDVNTLYRLGQFRTVTAQARLEPRGTVAVEFVVIEQVLIGAVQVVGNKLVSDQELRAVIPLFAGAPRDDFLVEQSIRDIKALYRQRGHYLVDVAVDESRLVDTGILIFRIVEGPRVRIRSVVFEGNASFDARQLAQQVKTKPFVPLFRKGQLDEDILLDDVASLVRWYRDRGFNDVRVDRRIDLSADSREAKVVFVIAEGRQYRIRRIEVFSGSPADPRPLEVLAPEQIVAMLAIQRGDVYSQDLVRRSIRVVKDAYGLMGYVDAAVVETSVRVGEEPLVDLLIGIREGRYARAGLVRVQGNFLTKDKVVRREVRIQPGRPLDARELEDAEARIRRTRIFGEPVRIAVQSPERGSEDDPEGEVRDVLVEVRERNTGSVNFGVAVGTDSGLFGEFSIRQDNFDVADPPQSMESLVTGRAFRGAGQRFNISVAPGVDVSTFSVTFGEPRLFDTDLGGTTSAFYRLRDYDQYDEERLGFNGALTVRLGDVWSAAATARVDRVNLTSIDFDAPVDVFEAAGPDWLTGLGLRLRRTAVDRPARPTRGTTFEVIFEQVGAMGGDYTYPLLRGDATAFFTLDEDFLGRRSVLRLNTQVGYIFDDAPLYERFYLGGRSLRGFEFRTVSPKGIDRFGNQTNDPVGGYWLFFAGAQYEVPLFGEFLSVVAFVDSGTVTDDVGFDEYRVGIGGGLRLYIPQFGQLPFAFDFAYPAVKQDGDEDQVFSFSAELPF